MRLACVVGAACTPNGIRYATDTRLAVADAAGPTYAAIHLAHVDEHLQLAAAAAGRFVRLPARVQRDDSEGDRLAEHIARVACERGWPDRHEGEEGARTQAVPLE